MGTDARGFGPGASRFWPRTCGSARGPRRAQALARSPRPRDRPDRCPRRRLGQAGTWTAKASTRRPTTWPLRTHPTSRTTRAATGMPWRRPGRRRRHRRRGSLVVWHSWRHMASSHPRPSRGTGHLAFHRGFLGGAGRSRGVILLSEPPTIPDELEVALGDLPGPGLVRIPWTLHGFTPVTLTLWKYCSGTTWVSSLKSSAASSCQVRKTVQ